MRRYAFILAVFSLISTLLVTAQNANYEYALNKKDSLINKVTLYGALNHQHEDFFYKAFSYQGFEAGCTINDKINAGLFLSTFASDLQVEINNIPMFVNSWKTGVSVGETYHSEKILHTGWQISAGYFSLKTNDKQLGLFSGKKSITDIEGMLLEPQVYSEINILKWFKFRAGIAYSFFSFENHSMITKDDLNNISLNFGFVFF